MNTKEMRAMADEELEGRLKELSEDLFHLRFQHATGQLRNTAKLGQARRDVARVRTLLGERKNAK